MIRSGYTFSNSAEEIRRIAARDARYGNLLDDAQKKAEYARTHFHDDSSRISGWGHNFVCPHCASQMTFDVGMDYAPPHTYTCPHCGATASGQDYDEAWVYYYRFTYAQFAQSAALSALLGDSESLEYLLRYIDFYADRYDEFPVHGKHAGRGKVMGQSLDEAVWAIALIEALCLCGDRIPDERKVFWHEKLFRPIAELLIPQSRQIHNIPTWQHCCIGMIGQYFEDEELLQHALDSEFGLRAQVRSGFTTDGIWHEGSLLYHYYTVQALTNFLALYALRAPDDPLFSILEKMYDAPYQLSCCTMLPALNDGWYPLSITSAAPRLLRAARISADPILSEQLDLIRRQEPQRLLTLEALLYGNADDGSVLLYAATNLALLKQPFHALLKSGSLCMSHRHLDYLSLTLPPFSDDLGTPGYGHPLTAGWYRLAPSHNVVCVDEGMPGEILPTHVSRAGDGVCASMEENAWPGICRATRTLTRRGDSIEDTTVFLSEDEHTFDWFFHSIGRAEYSAAGAPAAPFGGRNGYAHFSDVLKMDCASSFTARFRLENGHVLTLVIPDTAGLEIYTAHSPGNPADSLRSSVILRRRGTEGRFRVLFTET